MDKSKTDFSRRELNRQALALALSPWLLASAQGQSVQGAQSSAMNGPQTNAGPRWQTDPFGLGVASGQPRPDSVVLWTRLWIQETDSAQQASTQSVLCELFADEALRQPVRQWRVTTQQSRAHSVHVTASGLQPGRTYWYRFACGNALSAVGRTRTSPAENAAVGRLRLALASCQHYEQGHFTAYRDMATQELDLVLFVGDYIYESSNARFKIRSHEAGEPMALEAYRARHAHYKSDPDLQACHGAHPWLMTWDDHEVVNDYANDEDNRFSDSATVLRRRAAAYQAYFEHMPVRLGPDPLQPANMRIHDRMAWGQLADVWTLDCRQHRSHHACPDANRGGGRVVVACEDLANPARTMLGQAQEDWLGQGLSQSQRRWKIVAQASQLSSTGLPTPLGRSAFNDGWDGYPLARERLLGSIAQAQVQNVLLLGGDVHMNVAAHLRVRPNDEQSPVVASEIVTTSISSRGMSNNLAAQIRDNNPDIQHLRPDERGYTVVDVQPSGVLSQFRSTAFPVMPASVFRTQAQWAVQSGVAGVVKA